MTGPDTVAAVETREITFTVGDEVRVHAVTRPTDGQYVQMLGLTQEKGIKLPEGATPEQREKIFRRLTRGVNLYRNLIAGLHVSQDDWDWIEFAMARGEMTDSQLYELIRLVLRAWYPDAETEPANRQQRRARAKRTP